MTTANAPFDKEAMREIVRDEIDLLRSEFREHYSTKADLSDLKAELKGTLIQVVIGLAGLPTAWSGSRCRHPQVPRLEPRARPKPAKID